MRDWRVEPLGLVLKAGAWYLVARGAGKIRIFRVSNILRPAIGEESFDRPADFDLPVMVGRGAGAFRGGAAAGDAPACAPRRKG